VANDKAKPYGWIIFAIFLCTVVNYVDRVNISIAAPEMIKEYGWSTAKLGVVFSSFFWGYLILQLPMGWLADKYGGRRILFGSAVSWAVFTLMTAFPSSILGLSTVRAALGAGEAANFPAQASFIGRFLPKRLVSRIQAFNLSAMTVGALAATPLAVYAMTHWGWRSVFYLFAGLSLLWGVWWMWLTTRAGMTDDAHIESASDKPQAADVEREAIFENPLRRLEVWGSSLVWYSGAYVFYFFLMWLPTYFVKARGLSPREMASVVTITWSVLFVMMNVAGYLVGLVRQRCVHNIFWRRMILVGALVWASVCIYFLQYATTSREAVVLICVGFVGLAFQWPVAWALPIEYAPKKSGIITAFMNIWGQVAGIVAPLITGYVIIGGNWSKAFLVTAMFALMGAILVGVTSRYSTGVKPQVSLSKEQVASSGRI
jgi:ACS family glucarate transporter-like MFS transporter